MRELILDRITEYFTRNLDGGALHGQFTHTLSIHGKYYEMFYPERKRKKPSVQDVQQKTLTWLTKLDDKALVNEFERIVILSNRGWA